MCVHSSKGHLNAPEVDVFEAGFVPPDEPEFTEPIPTGKLIPLVTVLLGRRFDAETADEPEFADPAPTLATPRVAEDA